MAAKPPFPVPCEIRHLKRGDLFKSVSLSNVYRVARVALEEGKVFAHDSANNLIDFPLWVNVVFQPE